MKKRVFSCILAVTVLTVFSGCGPLGRAMRQSAQNQVVTTTTTTTTMPTVEVPSIEIPSMEAFTQPEAKSNEQFDFTQPVISPTITSSYCSDEVEKSIQSLQTDYKKVAWGVRYSPLTGAEGVVVSVTLYQDTVGWNLIVGYTNLYDTPISISASGYAKDSNGGQNGSIFTSIEALGSGSTYVDKVSCKSMPTGEIHWDSFETKEPSKSYVVWEADYGGAKSDYEAKFVYKITNREAADVNRVVMLVVDDTGMVVDMGMDFPDGKGKTEYEGSVSCYGGALVTDKLDVCVFANPTK